MSDWLNEVIGGDLIAAYEGHYCTEDAVIWLRQSLGDWNGLHALVHMLTIQVDIGWSGQDR
jgi:hypothetical protein